ncbi:MAG TPA: glycosyltransferase [Candidatus Eisenbacteria bacterium]|nr:glycosyltransferase [Candidatus Eisenbacteria bacterium]
MRLRILMTADTSVDVWTFAMELATTVAQNGSQVDLALLGDPATPAQRTEADAVPRLHLHEGGYPLEVETDQAGEWLMDLERRLSPDIVHLNGYVHGALPWRAPVVMTGHACALSWWEAVHGPPLPATLDPYADEVRRGLRAAHVVAVPTRAMRDSVLRLYGERVSVRVIPNGRTIAEPPVIPKRHRVLFVGDLRDPSKNAAAMDRVAARLSWPVVVAGETRSRNGEPIRFKNARALGRMDRASLARAYAGAAIFALPALYEPFGYGALEAALSGCALVLGDIPTLREIWGEDACYVPPRDDQALLQTLRWLIEDRHVRRDYARRAKARAVEFTPERTAASYRDAYRMALAEPSGMLGAQA